MSLARQLAERITALHCEDLDSVREFTTLLEPSRQPALA